MKKYFLEKEKPGFTVVYGEFLEFLQSVGYFIA
jgi:hypothetical protein